MQLVFEILEHLPYYNKEYSKLNIIRFFSKLLYNKTGFLTSETISMICLALGKCLNARPYNRPPVHTASIGPDKC